MKNKSISFFAMLCFCVLFLNIVSAWAPAGHVELAYYLFENSNSKIIEQCQPYKDAFLLGSVTPDLMVIYYYTEGGKNYKLTHNWNFADEVMQNAITPDEVCFAYGVASHLIGDSISHNMFVPITIMRIKVPNSVTHPLAEQKYDSVLVNKDPSLVNKTSQMMKALYGSKGDRYVEMVEKALGDNIDVDVKSELTKLSYALDTESFYEKQYNPKGTSFVFKLYPYLSKLTVSLYPLIGDLNSGEVNYYFDKARELELSSFANWGSRYQISPHGFDALNEADKGTTVIKWLYLIIPFLIPAGLVFWRKNYWYLLLIPVLFLLEIVIIYAII